MVVCLKHVGIIHWVRERLKMSVNTLSTRPGSPSGPVALWMLTIQGRRRATLRSDAAQVSDEVSQSRARRQSSTYITEAEWRIFFPPFQAGKGGVIWETKNYPLVKKRSNIFLHYCLIERDPNIFSYCGNWWKKREKRTLTGHFSILASGAQIISSLPHLVVTLLCDFFTVKPERKWQREWIYAA